MHACARSLLLVLEACCGTLDTPEELNVKYVALHKLLATMKDSFN